MGWPQIVMIALLALGLGSAVACHGEPKTGRENVFVTVIGTAITVWLLVEGGFFK